MLSEQELRHEISVIDVKIRKLEDRINHYTELESELNYNIKTKFPKTNVNITITGNGINSIRSHLKRLQAIKESYMRILEGKKFQIDETKGEGENGS